MNSFIGFHRRPHNLGSEMCKLDKVESVCRFSHRHPNNLGSKMCELTVKRIY